MLARQITFRNKIPAARVLRSRLKTSLGTEVALATPPLSVWLGQMWFETHGPLPAQYYRLRLKRP